MKRKITLIFVLTLLSIIPMLYSGLFLGASKDPYGNLNKLPVALVDGEDNIVKDKLIESKLFDIKKEKSLASAHEDLKAGNVYSIINFDNDFQNRIMNYPKTKESASITLTISEGLNYFSSKVITSTMKQFVEKVNTNLSNTMISKMNGMGIPQSASTIIHLNTKDIYPVKNNSEAMAPYLFSLTLFVGAIFVNQFIMRNLKKKGESLPVYWTKQFLISFIIGIGQVLLLMIGNSLFIHVPMTSLFKLMAFLFLTSATFYSIIVGFNKLIPGIGSLIVLLLTMLQTSSAAGVYPIVLSSKLFQHINNCIPMTYSIRGLRSIISMGSTNLINNVYILIGFLIFGQFLILISYLIHEKKFRTIAKNN